jgi:uncharacterized protein (TIGR03435 family)
MRRLMTAGVLLLATVAVPVARLHGQAAQTAGQKAPAFEVASIKRNVSLDRSGTMGFEPGGRFHAVNAPLLWLISTAYGEFQRPLFESQIAGAPDWLDSEHYDITAKAGADFVSNYAQQEFRDSRALLQSLLGERFGLKVHHDTRQLPIYVLTRVKSDGTLGPRMTRSVTDCATTPDKCSFSGLQGHVVARSITLDILTGLASNAAERIVIDRTGLEGRFDIDLEWSPDQAASEKPSIFTAVQEQLGLKLESTKGPVDVLVIDHVEKPTPD